MTLFWYYVVSFRHSAFLGVFFFFFFLRMFQVMHARKPSITSHSSCYCVVQIVSVHCVFHELCSCKQHIFTVDELGQVFAECFCALVHSELKLAFPSQNKRDGLCLSTSLHSHLCERAKGKEYDTEACKKFLNIYHSSCSVGKKSCYLPKLGGLLICHLLWN